MTAEEPTFKAFVDKDKGIQYISKDDFLKWLVKVYNANQNNNHMYYCLTVIDCLTRALINSKVEIETTSDRTTEENRNITPEL